MSRIGKQPVVIPAGVKASIAGDAVKIEGPLGKLELRPPRGVNVVLEGGRLLVSITAGEGSKEYKQGNADWGTTRALLNNMVLGVTKGWKRSLEMSGVGFNANLKGNVLVVSAGYSHQVNVPVPAGVKVTVTKNVIDLECCDRNVLGIIASKIRSIRKPEPYLGKGIKYSEEKIRKKAGKAGKK